MFVRLFVDENLDRMVPISKQPKEKIQAIIESCSRQFPEFQERARKRIRTYLKSCRRMKKNGMEMVSPQHPPPPNPLHHFLIRTVWDSLLKRHDTWRKCFCFKTFPLLSLEHRTFPVLNFN